MPSPLQWKSIDFYQYMSSLIWLSPIQWISKEQEFKFVPLSSSRLIPWHFICIFCFSHGVVGSFYVPIRELIYRTGNVSIVQLLVKTNIGLIAGFGWCINFSVVTAGRRSILVVNRLITFYKGLSYGIILITST
jgi:hypothetical protein